MFTIPFEVRKFKNIALLSLLSLMAWGFTATQTLAQCPMCKAAVTSGGHNNEESALAGGLNGGILYLFVLPYLAVMILGIWWYTRYRKHKAEEQARSQEA